MPEKVQRMLPYQCTLLPYPQLHQGVQRVLQIRGFLLLQQEIKMLPSSSVPLERGGKKSSPTLTKAPPAATKLPPTKGRVPRRIHAPIG